MERYSDMLAALLAAKDLSDHGRPDDPEARAQILRLIEPVERRLGQLNDHQGRLAQFGAGNIAGQAALDMSEAAVRSWRQLLALGAMVRTEELVLRFRAGAEVLQFLTGEQRDAPTLREFDHVSSLVGKGAAAIVLAPALAAVAAAEAPLLAFAAELAARRVALWALMHPAAALAASEVLLGFGLQIGEGGWETFWAQLRDPQGRWFILAQVLIDYMHVRGSMGSHDGPTSPRRPPQADVEPAPDLDAARQHLAKARAALKQVHDAVAGDPEPGHTPAARDRDTRAGSAPAHEPDAPPRRTQTELVHIEGLAQTPKMFPWRKNPDGMIRTVAEARGIAAEHGVHIPDDVHFIAVDSKSLPKHAFARYFSKLAHSPDQMVSWDEFYNQNDNIPVRLSRDILGSDEAIVAVVAHEMHELNSLREIFEQRGGRIPGRELRLLTVDGRPGNLHDHAWDVADRLVAKMRAAAPPGEIPSAETPRGTP